jgi:hypothetical protein
VGAVKSLALMSLVRAFTIVLLLALVLPVLTIKLPGADTPGQAAAVSTPSPAVTPAAVISSAKPMASVAVAATAPPPVNVPAPAAMAPAPQPSRQSFAPPWGPASVAFGPPSLPPPHAPGPDTQLRRQQQPPSARDAGRPTSARDAGRPSSTAGSKEPPSRNAQGPAPRQYHTPPAPYRYGPRVDHRTSEQRQAQSSTGPSRYDPPPRDARASKTSRSTAAPDRSRDAKTADRNGVRAKLSEQKRQALMREYNTMMRRQAEIERELTASLPGRPGQPASKRDRYSDASGR